MIQEFLIISPRGDTLLTKNYAGSTVQRSTADTFLQHITKNQPSGQVTNKCSVEPIFVLDGVTYCFIQSSKMYFVLTTVKNMQCTMLVELLCRLSRVFKDYCGVLTEESVRRNFLLLYELLDEVFDRGAAQSMATELLKAYVHNEAAIVAPAAAAHTLGSAAGIGRGLGSEAFGKQLNLLSDALASKASFAGIHLGEKKTVTSAAANKPITHARDHKSSSDNTIFVDVIEHLTVVVDRNGAVVQQYINGAIQLRSFLTGTPEMRLGLNQGLGIKSLSFTPPPHLSSNTTPVLPLDDVALHECLRWEEGALHAPSFTLFPPDGEFCAMSYRILAAFPPPVIVTPFLECSGEAGSGSGAGSSGGSGHCLHYILRLRADFPADKTASQVVVTVPLPPWAHSVSVETASSSTSDPKHDSKPLSAGRAEVDRKKQSVAWIVPKLVGGAEVLLRAKIVLGSHRKPSSCDLSEFGLVKINFELPMYVVSGLQIKCLDFLHGGKTAPNKWIRYMTQSHSYVGRWT